MTISTHTHACGLRGEYESGTLKTLKSAACQLAFSEKRIPFPSHHVFTQSLVQPAGPQSVSISHRPDGLQRRGGHKVGSISIH